MRPAEARISLLSVPCTASTSLKCIVTVDEKPQIQALKRTAPTLPMLATAPERATHDYDRNGTCDLFAALDKSRLLLTALLKAPSIGATQQWPGRLARAQWDARNC